MSKKETTEQYEKEEVKSKKSINGWFIGLIVLVVVLGAFFAINFYMPKLSMTGNAVLDNQLDWSGASLKNCEDKQVSYEGQEEYMKTEYYTEQVPYTDKECESKNLVYSATNSHWVTSECTKSTDICYESHWYGCSNGTIICSERTLSYAVDINNLDQESGSWIININFFKNNQFYKSVPVGYPLYPQTTKTFTGTITVTAETPSGDANQQWSASYKEQTIPTKQVCRDVTKYKEIQRERQVTAYRPVTKYKTEEVCN